MCASPRAATGDELRAGTNQMVPRLRGAQKRKIMEGDKMAGRHATRSSFSRILPRRGHAFLPDGTPVDIILIPSRAVAH